MKYMGKYWKTLKEKYKKEKERGGLSIRVSAEKSA